MTKILDCLRLVLSLLAIALGAKSLLPHLLMRSASDEVSANLPLE
jgi:hypothetical protein